ncbi:SIMPL domain-containing protein [Paenibacillus sp. MBLB4367]|uniref:SIMPL domain-containing protein n=1 Tax=Paenibacillus sp. MBLB4367 TaxID=3384767 RepID=UPI003908292A
MMGQPLSRSKKWLIGSVAAGALVLAAPFYSSTAAELIKPATAEAAGEQSVERNTIQVSGQGEFSVTPDVAYVTFAIQTEGKTANEAQKANADTFAKLEKLLYDTYKFDKKDVKTSGFNVQPQYSYEDKQGPKVTGYTANHSVTVTYRDLAKIGELLDAASEAGVNRVNGIQFGTEKGQDYELQVIEKAMANAETKAKSIAKYAGKSLKGIIHVEQSSSAGTPRPVELGGYAMAKSAAMDSATSIQAGELTLTGSVQVTFEFQ